MFDGGIYDAAREATARIADEGNDNSGLIIYKVGEEYGFSASEVSDAMHEMKRAKAEKKKEDERYFNAFRSQGMDCTKNMRLNMGVIISKANELGKTLNELSRETGHAHDYLNNIARNPHTKVRADSYKGLAKALGVPVEEIIQYRGQQGTATTEEATARAAAMKTQGRKGCKASRINMAFTPENMEFICAGASLYHMTLTEFCNKVLAKFNEENPRIMELGTALMKEVASGVLPNLL